MCQLFLENPSPGLCADEYQACYLEATLSKLRLSLSIKPTASSTFAAIRKWFATQVKR